MPLNKQLPIYSVDTSAFYTKEEQRIHNNLSFMYSYRSGLKKKLKKKNISENDIITTKEYIANINKNILVAKDKLKKEIDSNMFFPRVLNTDFLNSRKVVSVFDSDLTRILEMDKNIVNDDILIIQTYFFGVSQNLIKNGFLLKYIDENQNKIEEKYVVYTASAGQIRKKKTVFIKESVWEKTKNTFLCGLTVDVINQKGGVNTNKFLAYLALNNSATDEWSEFNIDKAIVVDDMTTTVTALFDYIDHKSFEIERKELSIEIEQTDGFGMMLHSKFKKAHMVRCPFIKGLLVPVPYKKFIKEKKCSGKVIDIYGKEWDVIEDDIEVIFTKSQFKMWKYYESWDHYKECFKKYNCKAGICNEEEDFIGDSRLNYQMLQTLTDIKDSELKKLAETTINDINSVGSNRESMLRILGVKPENRNKNPFQQALGLYPEMLQEPYAKEVLKQTRQSLIKDAKAGKIRIKGKYTFVIPDVYAFCEWLFLGDKNPKGLLKRDFVSCNMYDDGLELDCLRSPHLYKEHAIKTNLVNPETKKWFKSKGVYVSTDDTISRLLQLDWDGDRLLVSPDKTLVTVAKRNMEGVVPLYYEMKKAENSILDSSAVFEGLRRAYTGGNIGIESNDICKMWNSEKINEDVINSVKIKTAYNNYVIDYAKTLYKPIIPKEKADVIKKFTKRKLPHFFMFVKDKDENQVESINNSVMGRLEKIIPDKRLLFKVNNLKKFDYKILMSNSDIEIDDNIIELYEQLNKNIKLYSCFDGDNYSHITGEIKNKLLDINPNIVDVCDMLIKHLYKKHNIRKVTLWECFGDIIVNNIKENTFRLYGDSSKPCVVCGERIQITSSNNAYCDKCKKEKEKEKKRKYWNKTKNK